MQINTFWSNLLALMWPHRLPHSVCHSADSALRGQLSGSILFRYLNKHTKIFMSVTIYQGRKTYFRMIYFIDSQLNSSLEFNFAIINYEFNFERYPQNRNHSSLCCEIAQSLHFIHSQMNISKFNEKIPNNII